MIQFIELVPVVVENENYEQEKKEFESADEFDKNIFGPPDKKIVRHENNPINYLFPWSDFENTKQIELFGKAYSVACVGPKEFDIQTGEDEFDQPVTTFIQKIYIQKL
jgi:hypothetical protein